MSTDNERLLPLRIGWETDPLNPKDVRYWDSKNSAERLGAHPDNALVAIDPKAFEDTHSVIVAQSGAGKTFFLGRILEEILTRSRARCIVLDPNSDFSRARELSRKWTLKTCLRERRFHTEDYSTFKASWLRADEIEHRSGSGQDRQRLGVVWQRVRTELIAQGLDPVMQRDVQLLHDAFRAVSFLTWLSPPDDAENPSYAEFRHILERYNALISNSPPKVFNRDNIQSQLTRLFPVEPEFATDKLCEADKDLDRSELLQYLASRTSSSFARIANAQRAVQETARRFYKSTALQLDGTLGFAAYKPTYFLRPFDETFKRLEVTDLLSIRDPYVRMVVVSSLLEREWVRAQRVRERRIRHDVPDAASVRTFIVIDEAHNLLPARDDIGGAAAQVREQIRTFAAEGRKFLLSIILVSQRPDKLDPLILSECGNRAVMRLDSEHVARMVNERLGLGLDDPPEAIIGLAKGYARLFGPWGAQGGRLLMSAPRRTAEGAPSSDVRDWAMTQRDYERSVAARTKSALPAKAVKRTNRRPS